MVAEALGEEHFPARQLPLGLPHFLLWFIWVVSSGAQLPEV